MTSYKNILIFGLNYIGDTVMYTPTIHNIRNKYQDSFITVITGNKGGKSILLNNPYIDQIIEISGSFYQKYNTIKSHLNAKPELAIIINTSFESALLCLCLGIKNRVGLKSEFRSFILTNSIKCNNSIHHTDKYLSILNCINIEKKYSDYELFSSVEADEYIKNLLINQNVDLNKFNLVISPSSTRKEKQWNKENFIQLGNMILSAHDINFFLIGSYLDSELLNEISSGINKKTILLNGTIDIGYLYSFFQKMNLLLTGDNGLMHIAAATNFCHVIALFGQTNPKLTGPHSGKNTVVTSNLKCSPCNKTCRINLQCMQDISVENINEIILTQLNIL